MNERTQTETSTTRIAMPKSADSIRSLNDLFTKLVGSSLSGQFIVAAMRTVELSKGTVCLDDFRMHSKFIDGGPEVRAELASLWYKWLEFLEVSGMHVEKIPSLEGDLYRVLI